MPISKRTQYERTIDKSLKRNNIAKSLAYFIFREVIEDAHSKYNISDDDMMVMNKMAVNRAAAFLRCMENDERLSSLVQLLSLETTGWDNPRETADTRKYLKIVDECANELHSIKGKTNGEIAARLSARQLDEL